MVKTSTQSGGPSPAKYVYGQKMKKTIKTPTMHIQYTVTGRFRNRDQREEPYGSFVRDDNASVILQCQNLFSLKYGQNP
jgi:hypothetical protein